MPLPQGILQQLGVTFTTYTKSIGPVTAQEFHPDVIDKNALYMPDAQAAQKASAYLEQCMKNKDSAGGIIECRVNGVPAGLGDPVFNKLDALLAQAIMSIGCESRGNRRRHCRQSDDRFCRQRWFLYPDGQLIKNLQPRRRHHGRHQRRKLEIILRAHIKPTASISQPQDTQTNSDKTFL